MAKNSNRKKNPLKVMLNGDIGKSFLREDLGIYPSKSFHGFAEYDNMCYMFFTICNSRGNTEKGYYDNELHMDGVVFEPDSPDLLIKKNEAEPKFGKVSIDKKVIYVFVRYYDRGQATFEYMGEAIGFVRYDQRRNKVLVNPPNKKKKKQI